MDEGPPSVTVSLGEEVHIPCLYNHSSRDSTFNVTWWRIIQGNATWPDMFWSYGQGPRSELSIQAVNKSHIGLYRCRVEEKGLNQKAYPQYSCGTYLRVRGEPVSSTPAPSRPTPAPPARWGVEPVSPSLVGIPASRSCSLQVRGFAGLGLARTGLGCLAGWGWEALVL